MQITIFQETRGKSLRPQKASLVPLTFISILILYAAPGVPIVSAQPGSLDPNFNPPTSGMGRVHSIAVQPDGKVLGVGEIGLDSGAPTEVGIARLNVNGSRDALFNPGDGAN